MRFQYQAADGGFAVAVVREMGEDRAATDRRAKGPIGHLAVGAHVVLEGRWEQHPRHGR